MILTHGANSLHRGGGTFGVDSIKTIVPIDKMVVVDSAGFIGFDLTPYFQYRGSTYNYNYAILSAGDDFSGKGMGKVTFYKAAGNVIGGREYQTVIIGGKEWLAENLDFKFTGLAVGQSGTSSSEPRANYYRNDEATYGVNGNKYGLLYNWIAVKYLVDRKGSVDDLIPGWHVPTATEWDALVTAVGGVSVAGKKLKSTTGWSSGNGDGSYGFEAFPAGLYTGSFVDVGSLACFWTATEEYSNQATRKDFNTGASIYSSGYNKDGQYSVRLVKDT